MKSLLHKYAIHTICWISLYLFWIVIFQKTSFALSKTATIEFCYLVFIAANFYFNVYYTLPRFLYKKRYLQFALLFVLGVLVAALLRIPFATYLNAHYFLIGKPQPTASALFIASFLNITIWTLIFISFVIVKHRFRLQQHLEQIREEKSKAELDLLNAQLNPHFLFNSIHSIYGNIDKNNTGARKMLLTFSNMLRYQLYDCNTASTQIEKELNYIQDFVTLQRARKEEDLVVNVNIDNSVRGSVVAPLLFICFVENAFKFVGSNTVENKVEISFYREANTLNFRCFNTKEPIPVVHIEHHGIGIENAKRRLALHYPRKHSLDIHDGSSDYQVDLSIELNEMEMYNS
ncbi:MAG: sensor histidine kinase [Flavisolibacter sp.]